GADLCVMRRGLNARVTEERLDHPNVGTVLEQMRCESVPQRMERDLLLEPNLRHGDPQYLPDGIAADRRPSTATGKQVRTSRSRFRPVPPEHIEQLRTEENQAVLGPLRSSDVKHHSLAVYVLRLQPSHLRDPQPGAVGDDQHRPILRRPNRAQDDANLVPTRDRRQPLWDLRPWQIGDHIVIPQNPAVQEADRRYVHAHARCAGPSITNEMKDEILHLTLAQLLRRPHEVRYE